MFPLWPQAPAGPASCLSDALWTCCGISGCGAVGARPPPTHSTSTLCQAGSLAADISVPNRPNPAPLRAPRGRGRGRGCRALPTPAAGAAGSIFQGLRAVVLPAGRMMGRRKADLLEEIIVRHGGQVASCVAGPPPATHVVTALKDPAKILAELGLGCLPTGVCVTNPTWVSDCVAQRRLFCPPATPLPLSPGRPGPTKPIPPPARSR